MIKTTLLESNSATKNNLFILPGGPGLSSLTMRTLDMLRNRFNLHYFDMPGTNDNKSTAPSNILDLCNQIAMTTTNTSNSDIYLLGHSFGGLLASAVSLKINPTALICVSAPLSEASFDVASKNYENNMSGSLIKAEEKWLLEKTDQSFGQWLSAYDNLYFNDHSLAFGKDMLLNDKVSAELFLKLDPKQLNFQKNMSELKLARFRKLMIIGRDDGILSVKTLKNDSEAGNFHVEIIDNANHFVHIDQPSKISNSIIKFCFP